MSCVRRLSRILGVALVFATVFVMYGCAPVSKEEPPRVILIGIDGADRDTIERLGADLPNFRRLIENGNLNHLATEEPTISPALWSTVATGRSRRDHGVLHFFGSEEEATQERLIVSDRDLLCPPLWEILPGEVDVAVVNWWATWPAQPVNGVKLSNLWPTTRHIIDQHERAGRKIPFSLDAVRRLSVYPEDVLDEFARFELTSAPPGKERELMLDPQRFRFHYDLPEFYSQVEATVHILETRQPRFAALYFWILDHVQHNFFNTHREPVDRFYREMDAVLGRIVAAAGPEATFVILSDHGFKDEDPDARHALDHHEDAGILLISGPLANVGARVEGATLYDIAPTVLGLYGVPASEEMPGRFLEELFRITEAPPARVASYERDVENLLQPGTEAIDEFELERLKSLGYVN